MLNLSWRLFGARFVDRLRSHGALLAILALGAFMRLIPGFGSDFPVGDGGLYLRMVEVTEANGFTPPPTITYGDSVLPFAYPPLAFIVTALLHALSGVSILTLMGTLPRLFAIGTIGALYLVASELFRFAPNGSPRPEGHRLALTAALIFALTPGAYSVIMLGGGLTKAPGLFFALLAVWRGVILFRSGRVSNAATVSLFAGIAALCHPDGALFTTIALGALWLGGRHTFHSLMLLIVAAFGGLIVTLPWWLPVLLIHGPAPLLSAGTIDHGLGFLLYTPLSLPLLSIQFRFAFLILFVMTIRMAVRHTPGLWLTFILWPLCSFALDQRNYVTNGSVIAALLVAPLIVVGIPHWTAAGLRALRRRGWLLLSATVWSLLRILTVFITVLAIVIPTTALGQGIGPRVPLSSVDRSAMDWVATNTPVTARFEVLTGVAWWYDDLTEWFPALAERASLGTVQGYEWAGSKLWTDRILLSTAIQACARTGNLSCLRSANQAQGAQPDYLYVAGPDGETARGYGLDLTAKLRAALEYDPAWSIVFQSSAATIYIESGISLTSSH